LKFDDVQANVAKLFNILRKPYTERKSTKRDMHDLLLWLWSSVVEMVLTNLGFISTPPLGSEWPRVFWLPVGALSVFPIHAAGDHSPSCEMNVISRVISSYIPSIKALDHARRKATKLVGATEMQKAVLIVMPTTPEWPELRDVVHEKTAVLNVWGQQSSLKVSTLPYPNKAKALENLTDATIVHFSCHGEVSSSSPSASRLLLSDWQKDPLTVVDLERCTSPNAEMAFLSACHGANTRNMALLDENIHMATGCMLTGFRNVIGTLWHIGAKDSVKVTESVYKECITIDGRIDHTKSAAALHFAVRGLRQKTRTELGARNMDDPVEWAAYIHVGV
jgi:CHAT domain-containing protein